MEQTIAEQTIAEQAIAPPQLRAVAADTAPVLRARGLFEEQIRQLYAPRIMIAANGLNAVLVVAIAYGTIETRVLASWLSMMAGICSARLALHIAYDKSEHKRDRATLWARAFAAATGVTGFAWAYAAFFLVRPMTGGLDPLDAVIAITVAGLSAGSLATAALYLPAFYAFVLPANLMLVAVLLWAPTTAHLAVAVMIIFFVVFLIRFSQSWNVAFLDSLERQLNAQALVSQLQLADGRDRMILEAVDEGIHGLDLEGRVTFINPAGARMLGYEIGELLGENFHDMVHYKHPDGTAYPVEDCPTFQTLTDRKARHISGDVFWHRDGTPFHVEYRITPLMNEARFVGVVVAVSDVTDRVRAEQNLRESEDHLRRLMNGLPVLIASFDRDGCFLFANRLCCEWAARPLDRIIGRTAAEILGDTFADLAHEAITETDSDDLVSHEATFTFPDGTERTVEYSYVTNLTDMGEIESVYILGADISHLNEIERQARELARQAHLRELRESYSSAARLSLMDHFSSILAHELNQPLTAISNYLAVSRRLLETNGGNAPPELGELFVKAGNQADRAAEIIQGLRDLAQAGRVDFKLDSIDDIIAEACELTLPDDAERRLDLRLEFAEGLPPMAVHRVQMQQLFGNLLRNSLEAMADSEHPVFRIATEPIDDGRLAIVVEDNGPGLSEEMKKSWMSPFVTSKDSGLGIGLSICRSIVDAHGGTIELSEGALGGFCVRIELPINTADPIDEMD